MFTGNHMATSFKKELLGGVHDFSTHVFKLALFTNDAALNAGTTAYATSDEVSGAGYTAGGADLTASTVDSSGTTAFVTFDDVSWADATLTARGGLLYNSSVEGNPAVVVLDFGADKVSNGTTFTVQFPTASADTAVIRIR